MAPPSGTSLADIRLGHSLGQPRSSERDQRAGQLPRNGIVEKSVPSNRPNKALKDLNWRSRASENEPDEDTVLVSSDLNLLPTSKYAHNNRKTNAVVDCEARRSLDENIQPSKTIGRVPFSEAGLSNDRASGESNPIGRDSQAAAGSTADGTSDSLERATWAMIKRHVQVPHSADNGPALSIIKLQPVAEISSNTTSSNPYYGQSGMHHVRVMRVDKHETSRVGAAISSESRNRHIKRNDSHGMGSRGAFAKPSYNARAKESPQHKSDSYQEGIPNDSGTMLWNDELSQRTSSSQFSSTFPQQAPGSRQNYSASHSARNNSHEARDLQASQDTQIRLPQQSLDSNRRILSQDFSGDSGYASITFGNDGSERSVSGGSSGLHSGQVKASISNQFNPRARDFLPLNDARDSTANIAFPSESMPAVDNDLIKICPPPPTIPGTQMIRASGNGAAAPSSGEVGQSQLVTHEKGVATQARQRVPVVPFHHQADRSLLQVVSVPMPAGFVPPALYGIRPQDCGLLPPLYGPPRPVPKPRCPNAMAQNEYEAWIEHQKAITPGYALECRLRQQQRAQRKLQSRQKPSGIEKAESEVASVPEKAQSVGA